MTTYKLVMLVFFVAWLLGQAFLFGIFSLFDHNEIFSEQLLFMCAFPLLFAIVYYLSFGRFYSIYVDDNKFYYNCFLDKGQIDFSQLVSIDYFFLPYRLFFKRAYSISLTFTLPDNKRKKITFLSREVSYSQGIDDIVEYSFLEKIIADNKK